MSTNSTSQGEQVSILWNQLLNIWKIKLHFAHRTFAWGSDARGKAHVHCVIIGFGLEDRSKLRLFDYVDSESEPHEVSVSNLSPYLIDYPSILIHPRRQPLTNVRPILYGSKPVDDGNLLLEDDEKKELLRSNPVLKKFVRPMLSADEYINGEFRWCLWLVNASPVELKQSPELLKRIKNVRFFRLKSVKPATQKAAERPHEFAEIRQPESRLIVVPMHSSEKRHYIPFGFEPAKFIVHNSCTCVPDGSLSLFGQMLSLMHMTWMRYTAGRLESRYRYANTLVYNTFPWAEMTKTQETKIAELAQAVLDARAAFPNSTLADLYDPDLMPTALRRAHHALDLGVDRLYRRAPFASERERVEHLFGLYEKMIAPIEVAAKAKVRKNSRTKTTAGP